MSSWFQNSPLWLNLGAFAVAALVIWFAGTKLERYADGISTRTGIGQAFIGLVLLSAATSLPEVATTTTASLAGNTSLAVHNLLGGVVIQTAVLAVADIVSGREALTHRAPRFVLLMEGVGVVFVLSIALMGMAVGGALHPSSKGTVGILGIGLWAALLLGGYLLVLYLTHRSQGQIRWQPTSSETEPNPGSQNHDSQNQDQPGKPKRYPNRSLGKLSLYFAGASLLVLVAGWAVTKTGEALAQQTGLGSSFIGATLVAIATSLPEVSVTVTASREGHYEMAFSNIFGSNAFDVTLLVLVGLIASGSGQRVLGSAPTSAMFAAGVGVFVTCIYLWGLLEREDRSILRMGWDSAAVLIVALAGIAGIYALK